MGFRSSTRPALLVPTWLSSSSSHSMRLSRALWSTYTCLLAYNTGQALAGFPLASVVISGIVTTAVIGVLFVQLRRRTRAADVSQAAS